MKITCISVNINMRVDVLRQVLKMFDMKINV